MISVDVNPALRTVNRVTESLSELPKTHRNAMEEGVRQTVVKWLEGHNNLTYAEKHVRSGSYVRGNDVNFSKSKSEFRAIISNQMSYDIYLENRYRLFERTSDNIRGKLPDNISIEVNKISLDPATFKPRYSAPKTRVGRI